MFDFGIEGYQPRWLNGCSAVMAAHGRRLRALIGRPLTGVWLVWNRQDGEWFSDCPVLLDFDGEQLEINHAKLDDLSLTWNTIDPRRPVLWTGFDLKWCRGKRPEVGILHQQTLRDVELLERTGTDMDEGTVAVCFRFMSGQMVVLNALDENGMAFEPPDSYYRCHGLR
ncbi:hypothetical protein GCM10007079_26070 [Nocardiopsis terrae]|uniref:Uncharacterized protein n=1 Tax=Nocardiopsis terrae TaxID=372655 RepID=A0ABR9HFI4_9ACTN|nr:hypothetical protein [Nocardiopsis terrae]MBE1457790.1 hypothetical protein [Nocardiopsis terrae]GHC84256.1 hypothetical protein GCM10007079_26070 [Nocardiopsis terrae]